MDPKANYQEIILPYFKLFMKDFDASPLDAAAVFGNGGYESNGFSSLQEVKPTVKGSKGGYGLFQWTGPRRRAFEAYCKKYDLDPTNLDTNYKFLFVELNSTEKHALPKLKAATTLADKVIAFEEAYERAGVKRYPERQKWAQAVLEAYEASLVKVEPIKEEPAPIPPASVSFWSILLKIFRSFLK